MVRQYRAPLNRFVLEVPAGKCDVFGEPPVTTARRELGEEVGRTSASLSEIGRFYNSPGFTDEVVRVFLATGLIEIGRQGEIAHEEADLKIVRVPLSIAVSAALAGDIVNASTVAGLLAASIALNVRPASQVLLRPGDGAWTDGPGLAHVGSGVPDAPPLRSS